MGIGLRLHMSSLPINQILHGHVLTRLKELPDKSIDMCITSPPFFNQRDYQTDPIHWTPQSYLIGSWKGTCQNHDYNEFSYCKYCGGWYGELGAEPWIELYIAHLMTIFDEIKRVLRDDGSFWLEIGDGFNTGKKGNTNGTGPRRKVKQKEGINKQKIRKRLQPRIMKASYLLIPERIVTMMEDSGWGVRDKVVWYKSDGMPNSQPDRLTPDFTMMYRFTKQRYAYFDTQYEPYQSNPKVIKQYMEQDYTGQSDNEVYEASGAQNPSNTKRRIMENMRRKIVKFGGNKANGYGSDIYSGKAWNPNIFGRHKRSVWKLKTAKLKLKHTAPFSEQLIEVPIKATCPEIVCEKCGFRSRTVYKSTRFNTRPGKNVGTGKSGTDADPNATFHNSDISRYRQTVLRSPNMDSKICNCLQGDEKLRPGICLDPFLGSGTTAVVCKKLGRDWIGIELQESYIKEAMDRINNTVGS